MQRQKEGYLNRFRRIAAQDGFSRATEKAIELVQAHLGISGGLGRRRIILSKRLSNRLGGVVRHGPFAGLKIRLEATWGAGDRAGMFLGLYKKEVFETVEEALRDRPIFIDIGAADGYYAVGVLKAGLAKRSIAFEMNPKAHNSIRALAALNGVQDDLEIHSAAGAGSLASLSLESFDRCVVLCDIEGAEVDVLDDTALKLLSQAVIVIEVHGSGDLDEHAVEKLLRERAAPLFDIESFTTGSRSPLQISEISDLPEDDQWLICSEGRKYRQTWLVLRPKS